ncbi:MAG: flagellar export chaperone FliS [Oscillospiraceae bacterium]|jgi:flagellar protein FliS
MQTNAYAQYKNQSLSTMAPGELLVKLFDELIKQCRLAEIHIEKKDLAAANNSLIKSQTIVSTLDASLDMRFPISSQLRSFYIFFNQQLRKANIEKSVSVLQELVPLMKELRDSFAQAEKLSRRSQHGGRAV